MPGLPENILTQLTSLGHKSRLQRCYLVAQDLPVGETPPWGDEGIAFQYWPESLSDNRTSDWTPRNIPGGSHPIYQWTHGGERAFSFTSIFTTDTNPGDDLGIGTQDRIVAGDPYDDVKDKPLSGLVTQGETPRDIDLRSVVSWLRWFTYPSYDGASGGNSLRVHEPAKCLLVMPNTNLGYDGSDFILCVMRSCQVTYQAWFPNGFPRIIEVGLEFAEVVQSGDRVAFQDRKSMSRASHISSYLSRNTDVHG